MTDLARQREAEHGSPFARLPFSALVEAAGEPYIVPDITMHYEIDASRDAPGQPTEEPLVPRSPEIMHGLGNLLQNAIQFATHEVVVTTSWSDESVAVDIVDDGPGFPPAVLSRIGEPYISGRGSSAATVGAQHMGLGIFIAQSLLERTGAKLSFANLADGGAQVVIEWRRQRIAALEPATTLRETGE